MKTNQYTTLLVKDRAIKYDEKLNNARAVNDFLRREYRADQLPVEHVWQICLNSRLNAVGTFETSIGGSGYSVVDVATIARNALLTGASVVIIAHNHPSGSLNFSDDDIEATERTRAALKLFNIQLADHVIITEEDYTAYSERWSRED